MSDTPKTNPAIEVTQSVASTTAGSLDNAPAEVKRETKKLTTEEKNARKAHHWLQLPCGGRITGCGQPNAQKLEQVLFAEMGATCVVTLQRNREGLSNDKSGGNEKGEEGADGEEEEEVDLREALSKEEVKAGKLKEIRDTCEKHGKLWLHLPLSGANPGKAKLDLVSIQRLTEVAELVKKGHSIVLHCAAGMHRTGCSLYIVLRLCGYSPKSAVEAVKSIRQVTYEELLKVRKKIGMPLAEKAEELLGICGIRPPPPTEEEALAPASGAAKDESASQTTAPSAQTENDCC